MSDPEPDLLVRGTDPHQNVTDPQHWSKVVIFLKGNVQVYRYLVVCVQLYVAVLALQDIPASLVARELGPLHQEIQALLLDKIFHLLNQVLPQHLISFKN